MTRNEAMKGAWVNPKLNKIVDIILVFQVKRKVAIVTEMKLR